MEQQIKFTIGSVFKGEGFQQLKQSINQVKGYMGKAASASQQLATAMAMTNTAGSKCAQAVAGISSALATCNPMLIAMQAAVIGCNIAVEKLQEYEANLEAEQERLNAKIEETNRQMRKAFDDSQRKEVDALIQQIKNLGKEFDATTAHAMKLQDVYDKIAQVEDKGKMLDMQKQHAQSLGQIENPDERGIQAAQYKLEEQVLAGEIALQAYQDSLQKLVDQIENETIVKNQAMENLIKLQDERESVEKSLHTSMAADIEIRKKINDRLSELDKQIECEKQRRDKAENEREILDAQRLETLKQIDNQQKENQLKETEAQTALNDAKFRKAEEERKAAEAEAEKTRKEEELKEERERQKAEAERERMSAKALADAQQELVKAMNEYNSAIDTMSKGVLSKGGIGSGGSGGGGGLYMSTRRNDGMAIPKPLLNDIRNAIGMGQSLKGDTQANLMEKYGGDAYRQALRNGGSTKDAREAEKNARRNVREAMSSSKVNDLAKDAQRGAGVFKDGSWRTPSAQEKANAKANERAAQFAKDVEERKKGMEKSRESLKERAERLAREKRGGGGEGGAEGFAEERGDIMTYVKNCQNILDGIKNRMDKLGLK